MTLWAAAHLFLSSDSNKAVIGAVELSDVGSSAGSNASDSGSARAHSAQTSTKLVVTGPITSGNGTPFMKTPADLTKYGFTEKEFFLEGDATSYANAGGMTLDGKWTLTESQRAAFKTRMLVRRPADATKFNGTILVEWLNVSGGVDSDPGFMYNSELLMRDGYAYVGVSAQATGVEGGGFSLASLATSGSGIVPMIMPLKQYDPERYGTLKHPGDAYSYDMFSQAGGLMRSPNDVDVLEGLKPQRVIAYGESQSAGRMVLYVNGVHPIAKVFDGFFIHSRGASGSLENAAGGLQI